MPEMERWSEKSEHHVGLAKSRRATVLFQPENNEVVWATLIGDDGFIRSIHVAVGMIGQFVQKVQSEIAGTLVMVWGTKSTSTGPRPGGPPGPVGEPPEIRFANQLAHKTAELVNEAVFPGFAR